MAGALGRAGELGSAVRVEREQVRRFTFSQVAEHAVLMVSFTGLALTGLPQKYASLELSRWFIQVLGGIDQVRLLHHVLAFTLGGLGVAHVLALAARGFRYGWHTDMWPRLSDVRDLREMLRYFVGLREAPPRLGRFSYKEKFEYWAVVWGTAVMGLTGMILMYPESATRYLPGVAVPASRAAHGGEAVLAVLAILIWHMYNAHLRPEVFPGDPVIFTGRMSLRRWREEHPLEYEGWLARQGRATPGNQAFGEDSRGKEGQGARQPSRDP